MSSCRICGRQVEVSDSGQPMPCICIRRPSEAFLLDCVADCVGPAKPEQEPEQEPELWRCQGCGREFDGPQHSHGRAGHEPGCTGECRFCPIEIECGPIVRLGADR